MRAAATAWAWDDSRLDLILGLAGAALAASLMYTPIPFVLAVGIPASLYFISRPYEMLLLMVFLIPFNYVFKIGPVPLAVELLKVVLWVPFLIAWHDGRVKFIGSRLNKWFLILAGIIFFSLARTNDFPFSLKECVRLGSNLGLVYLSLNLVDSRQRLFQVFRVLTISTLVVACYGFYQFAIQDYGELFWIVNPRLDTSLAHFRDMFWPWRNRMISVLTSELELGHYFNMCLPIATVLWLAEARGRIFSKWLVIMLAMLAGLLLTFTFGAWAALAATTVSFVLLLDGKRRWKVVTGLFIVALASTFLILGPLRPFFEAKFFGIQIGSFTWDVVTRLRSWVFAIRTWWAHPLLGVGIGNYETFSAENDYLGWGPIGAGSSPHQTYLYLLGESGIVGLFTVLAILIGTIRSNLRLRTNPQLGLAALGLAFAITANLFGGFSDDSGIAGAHAGYLLWLMVGLSERLQNLVATESIGVQRVT